MKLAAVLLCTGLGLASADNKGIETVLEVANPPPRLEATLAYAPKTPLDKITITSAQWTAKANKIRTNAQGPEPLAIAFVVEDDETFLKDALAPIAKGLDGHGLAKTTPQDSFGMLISYATDTQTKVAMGPYTRITGAAFGAAKAHKGKKGASLSTALTLAVSEVTKVQAARKAIIIIGDGDDSDPKSPLADIKKQAAAAKIQVYAIVTKAGRVGEVTQPNVVAPAELGKELDKLTAHLVDRYYVTFPGAGMGFDGQEHEFVIHLDKQDLDPIKLRLK
ncbi:MAG TPA: vWA domain-containing protein [Kofleriaceae bacterium]